MRPVSFGEVLRAGVGQACASAPAALVLAGLRLLQALARPALIGFGILALLDVEGATWAVGLALGLELGAALVAALVLGGAVRQAAARLGGAAPEPLGPAAMASVRRSWPWLLGVAAVEFVWWSWRTGVLGASLWLFVRGLLGHGGALPGALGLALVSTLALPVSAFLTLGTERALARALVREEPVAVAGWEAASALLARPVTPLLLWALTGLVALAVAGSASALGNLGGGASAALAIVPVVLVAAISALVETVAQLVRLLGLTALELDLAGRLPRRAERVPLPALESPGEAPV